jgi:hypothetical protein
LVDFSTVIFFFSCWRPARGLSFAHLFPVLGLLCFLLLFAFFFMVAGLVATMVCGDNNSFMGSRWLRERSTARELDGTGESWAWSEMAELMR